MEIILLVRWLRYSDQNMGDILFCTSYQIEVAIRCEIMVADATFGVCPKTFYQLFTIHGLV